jgi:HK97 family phage major capsid protein
MYLLNESDNALYLRRETLTRAILSNSTKRTGDNSVISSQTEELRAINVELNRRNKPEEHPLLLESFRAWLRGKERVEHRQVLSAQYRTTLAVEGIPGGAYPGSSGGYFAPVLYQNQVEQAMQYAGPFPGAATVYHTAKGSPIGLPGADDVSNTASFIAEGSQSSQIDLTQNQVVLNSYKASSGISVMSMEEIEDVDVYPDLAGFLASFHGVRLGRLLNKMATVGTGSSQPTGFITSLGSAAATITGANANDGTSNAHSSIGTADLTTLQQAVDFAYYNEKTAWQVHPNVLASMRGQLDKQGRPLWPLLQNDVPVLNGFPVVPNAYLDQYPTSPSSPTVSYPVIAFGDWSRVKIRIAPLLVLRFSEAPGYAEYGKVGFATHMRFDVNIQAGGGSAIAYSAVVY